jgi:hypothetical protein
VSTAKSSATPADATIYGIDPGPIARQNGNPVVETSGAGTANAKIAYLTGAEGSNSVMLASYIQAVGQFLTGFPQGGAYPTGAPSVLTAGGPFAFYADISNGQSAAGAVVPITPGSVVLSNIPTGSADLLPQDAGNVFSQQMAFTAENTSTGGPFVDAPYVTGNTTSAGYLAGATETISPFTTTGMHGLRVSLSQGAGAPHSSVYTDFLVPVLNPVDNAGALVLNVANSNGIVTNAATSVSSSLGGTNPASTTNELGVAVLFATAGTQTVTVTPSGGAPQTFTEKVVANQLNVFNITIK